MEFAAALPQKERLSGLTTKVFLKRYAERYLPKEVVHRRKRGLSVPLNRWLRGPLQGWAEARLTSPMLAGAGVDIAAAAELLEEHCTGRADHARALWTLIVATEWLAWRARRCGQAAADNAGRRIARI
jgi:asparagine synthase (glutamine-hydrolysing)